MTCREAHRGVGESKQEPFKESQRAEGISKYKGKISSHPPFAATLRKLPLPLKLLTTIPIFIIGWLKYYKEKEQMERS